MPDILIIFLNEKDGVHDLEQLPCLWIRYMYKQLTLKQCTVIIVDYKNALRAEELIRHIVGTSKSKQKIILGSLEE